MARIIITKQPFAAVTSINITGTREMQLYDNGTGSYAPDRRLTPTILEPCIRIIDHSALLKPEAIVTQLGSSIKQAYEACSTKQEKEDYLARQMLTSIKWFINNVEITPGGYKDIQVNESEGSKTRGNLRVSMNNPAKQTEPLVFRFEGVLTDPVTKRSAKVTGERVLRLTTGQRGELTAIIEEAERKPFHLYKRPDGAFSSLKLFGHLYKDGVRLPTLSLFRFSVQAGAKPDSMYGVSLWGGEGSGATQKSSCVVSVDALIARTFPTGGYHKFQGGSYLEAEALCMPLFLFREDDSLNKKYTADKQQGNTSGTFDEWLYAHVATDISAALGIMFENESYNQWFGGNAGMTREERIERCPKVRQRIDIAQSPWQAKLTVKEGTYASGDCPVNANSTIHISVDVRQFGKVNSATTQELFTLQFDKLISGESVPGSVHEVRVAELITGGANGTTMQSATLPVATLTDRVTGLSYRVE